MKTRGLAMALAVCLLLTGCTGGLLEREYSTVEPHSSKFWESEASDTLRAENYQDIVNDLLILIGQHTEEATVRLYNFADDIAVAETLERATTEVQKETPMGAYAVDYITSASQAQRGYYEVSIQIGYRRTLEQLQAIVNATSAGALYSLLEAALDADKTELAVRIGYWGEDDALRLQETVAQLREDRELTDTAPWAVYCYPSEEEVELIEFDLAAEFPEEPESTGEEPAPEEELPDEAAPEKEMLQEN